MRNERKSALTKCSSGFSLFEAMMFVVIIGIIVALVLPSFSITQESRSVIARRNAQEVVSLATIAAAAGADVVVAGDLNATVARLVRGVIPTEGPFGGRTFRIRSMDSKALEEAKLYMRVSDEALLYAPKGSQESFRPKPSAKSTSQLKAGAD